MYVAEIVLLIIYKGLCNVVKTSNNSSVYV